MCRLIADEISDLSTSIDDKCTFPKLLAYFHHASIV